MSSQTEWPPNGHTPDLTITLKKLISYKNEHSDEYEHSMNFFHHKSLFATVKLMESLVNRIADEKLNSKDLYYDFADIALRRDHGKYEVDGTNLNKVQFQTLKGDHLKARILLSFKEKLSEAKDKSELQTIVDELKQSPEYKILETGQGWATKTFNLDTTSKKAFERMIEEKMHTLPSSLDSLYPSKTSP